MGLFDFLFPSSDALRSNCCPYIDLGLSVYWATMNVGARFDYEYGDSFRWGEVRPPKSGEPYKFLRRGSSDLSRYLTQRSCVKPDYQTTLLSEDDVAHRRMGGNWRMPTIDEMEELYKNCHWQALLINRTIRAYRITARNGNSILLPQVNLWTSSLHENNLRAYCLSFYSSNRSGPKITYTNRESCLAVRGVLPKPKDA